MTSTPSTSKNVRRPTHAAVSVGMPVCLIADATPGKIVGITEAYCIYQLDSGETMCVANWREVAIGNLCPAPALLPQDVAENDCQNASATVLRELLRLKHVSALTDAQQATLRELTTKLCHC